MTDIYTTYDCIQFVNFYDVGKGTDSLAEALEAAMHKSPPDDLSMMRLSLLEQAVSGRHDMEEFCVVTLYGIAMRVVSRSDPDPEAEALLATAAEAEAEKAPRGASLFSNCLRRNKP